MGSKNRVLKNIIYNVFGQFFILAVPFITAPYVARVLNAEYIGAYSYVLANCSYFVMFQNLGLPLYGQLKIAACRDDHEQMSTLFWEVFLTKILLSLISLVGYIAFLLLFVGQAQKLGVVFLLLLVGDALDITWFMNGIEAFKQTAIRNSVVRIFNLVFIFTLVKNLDDIYIYAIIMQGIKLAGSLSLWPYALKHLRKPLWNIKRAYFHIRASLKYFIPGIITTIFSSADKTMLGAMTGQLNEVGYYEQASKITTLGISIMSSIGNVLLPRTAYLYHNSKDPEEFRAMFGKFFRAVVLITSAAAFGVAAVSGSFVPVFFGPGYEKSAILLKILSVNLFGIVIGNLCAQQCLIARDRQRTYNIIISVNAIINIVLNAAVIKPFLSIGVSVTSAFAGILGLGVILFISRDIISLKDLISGTWKYLAGGVVMFAVVSVINYQRSLPINLLLKTFIGAITYISILMISRDSLLIQSIRRIMSKWRRGASVEE